MDDSGLHSDLPASRGIVVRCDVHSVLPPDYLRIAVEALERTCAAVVGGMQRSADTTAFTRAVALAMTIPLGAGDARYRLGGPEGPAVTVHLGVFRRAALEAAGGFDETRTSKRRSGRSGGNPWRSRGQRFQQGWQPLHEIQR